MNTNQQNISLSVIVPCYNVERYLDRSLGCLERQWNGRTDYEIILVNDASTDRTIDKLNEFKKRHPDNVTVIDKKVNEGVGMARNSGLDAAHGRWIVFMDPDDALVDNGYGSLLELTRGDEFDILSFGAKVVEEPDWNDAMTSAPLSGLRIEGVESSQDYMLNNHYGTCIKFFFKRELIGNQRFKPLVFLEDVVFVLPIFLSDAKVAFTEENIYFYVLRTSSTTNMIDAKRLTRGCDDVMTALKCMDQIKQGKSQAVQERITVRQNFYAYNLFTRLMLSNKTTAEIRQARQELQALGLLPFNGSGLKPMLYNFLCRHLGAMAMFRPVYRLIRTLRSKFIH